ncbi:PRC-barrel domain containing protein [Microbacterium horticulturae]|uniref:PRC-barrel domain containing protein n=1 Tax=Microbacterium horticulturae TaxID=3028316 RepID=A0ABY8BZ76_9MICO|nr:PRC-barrel domain containing protein [Microbacterium sp. KACC 23027]WEG09505.1 PRC-barrel domain containing protein [Microbacterium sp. KACC 23027]
MLLSELLDSRVHGPAGQDLGRVVDVRFRRGERTDGREGELTLIALIISPHSRMSFYGYERGRVNRPVAIAKLIAWIHRKSRVVPWECVQIVTDQGVFLGVEPPVIPLDVRRPISAQQP